MLRVPILSRLCSMYVCVCDIFSLLSLLLSLSLSLLLCKLCISFKNCHNFPAVILTYSLAIKDLEAMS